MPTVSAAVGCSPTARTRIPQRVWNRARCTAMTRNNARYTKMLASNSTGPISGIFDRPGIVMSRKMPGLLNVDWYGCISRSYRKPVTPTARTSSTTPSTIWSTRYRIANSASSSAINSPPMAAATRPSQRLAVNVPIIAAPNAPIRNWPSIAMLITPARSQSTPDSEPKISGRARKRAPPAIATSGMKWPATCQHRNDITNELSATAVASPRCALASRVSSATPTTRHNTPNPTAPGCAGMLMANPCSPSANVNSAASPAGASHPNSAPARPPSSTKSTPARRDLVQKPRAVVDSAISSSSSVVIAVSPALRERLAEAGDPLLPEPEYRLHQRRRRDEDHDHGLQDRHHVDRDVRLHLHPYGTGAQSAEQQPGQQRPVRGAPAEQGHGDPVEPDAADHRRGQRLRRTEQHRRAAEAGQPSGDHHHQHVRLGDAHAGGAGGFRVGADRAQFEAERGALQQPGDRPRGHHGEHDPEVDPQDLAGQMRQHRVVVHPFADRVVPARPLDAVLDHQPHQQLRRDVVEHDRGDHLVRPGTRLEPPRYEPVQGAAGGARHHRDDQVQHRWQVDAEADQPGGDRTEHGLTFAADVEHAGPERQGDRQAGEDQRRRVGQRLRDRVEHPRPRHLARGGFAQRGEVDDRALEQRRVRPTHRVADRGERVGRAGEEVSEGAQHILVGDHDDHGPDEQRQQDRQRRHGAGVRRGQRVDSRHPVAARPAAPGFSNPRLVGLRQVDARRGRLLDPRLCDPRRVVLRLPGRRVAGLRAVGPRAVGLRLVCHAFSCVPSASPEAASGPSTAAPPSPGTASPLSPEAGPRPASPVMPAISRPTCSRGVSGETMSRIWPRYITAIRSASANTSSSSVATSSTAVPRSRSEITRAWMNSVEPTSTPRVGWLAISSFSGRDISRATITFCWLPPDRVPASVSPDMHRTSNSTIRCSPASRIAAGFKATPEAYGDWSNTSSTRFSATEKSFTRPSWLRSSGM